MKREILEWIKMIIISIIVALVITAFVTPTVVAEDSMNPTLENNDYLLLNRLLYKQRNDPQRGDIIVFRTDLKTQKGNNKALIKRIIALPGDRITISEGKVYVNDSCLDEDYVMDSYTSGEIDMVIPEGKVFVMGDNRECSLDSRNQLLGLVDIEAIIGKAFIRIFPFRKMNLLY